MKLNHLNLSKSVFSLIKSHLALRLFAAAVVVINLLLHVPTIYTNYALLGSMIHPAKREANDWKVQIRASRLECKGGVRAIRDRRLRERERKKETVVHLTNTTIHGSLLSIIL